MNAKKIVIALVLMIIVFLSALIGTILYYTSIINNKDSTIRILANQKSQLENWLDESRTLFDQLNQTYYALTTERDELNASYQILMNDYTVVSSNYTALEQDYGNLSSQYALLFSDYNSLLEIFNNPLANKETPLTEELENWLATDETDHIAYNEPDFLCGDFSAMLSLHAKAKNWDMGMVAVFGYIDDEPFAHAFNAIVTSEGLVYVEPQTDSVWWYANHQEITDGNTWEFPDWGYVDVEQYIVILWYD